MDATNVKITTIAVITEITLPDGNNNYCKTHYAREDSYDICNELYKQTNNAYISRSKGNITIIDTKQNKSIFTSDFDFTGIDNNND